MLKWKSFASVWCVRVCWCARVRSARIVAPLESKMKNWKWEKALGEFCVARKVTVAPSSLVLFSVHIVSAVNVSLSSCHPPCCCCFIRVSMFVRIFAVSSLFVSNQSNTELSILFTVSIFSVTFSLWILWSGACMYRRSLPRSSVWLCIERYMHATMLFHFPLHLSLAHTVRSCSHMSTQSNVGPARSKRATTVCAVCVCNVGPRTHTDCVCTAPCRITGAKNRAAWTDSKTE